MFSWTSVRFSHWISLIFLKYSLQKYSFTKSDHYIHRWSRRAAGHHFSVVKGNGSKISSCNKLTTAYDVRMICFNCIAFNFPQGLPIEHGKMFLSPFLWFNNSFIGGLNYWIDVKKVPYDYMITEENMTCICCLLLWIPPVPHLYIYWEKSNYIFNYRKIKHSPVMLTEQHEVWWFFI